MNNWIAHHLNNKDWEIAEVLLNNLYEKKEITKEKWKKSMAFIYDGRAVQISEI